MPAPPGASNLRFAQRSRGTLNLNTTPGGQLIKYNSPANPNLKPFAEPPPKLNLQPPLQTTQPLPNLAELPKAKYTPLKPTISTASAIATGGAGGSLIASAGGTVSAISATNLGTLAALIWASNVVQLYKLWALSQPEPQFQPLSPSSKEDVEYNVSITSTTYNENYTDSNPLDGNPYDTYLGRTQTGSGTTTIQATGKIGEFKVLRNTGLDGYDVQLFCQQTNHSKLLQQPKGYAFHSTGIAASGPTTIEITGSKFWEVGEPEPTTQPQPELQPQLKRQAQPLPQQAIPQFAEPEPPKPKLQLIPNLRPLPERLPIRVELPNDKRITITTPGQAPIQINQPQPTTSTREPTVLTIPRDAPVGQPQPIQLQQPGAQPITFTSPSDSPVTITIPGFQPITINPRESSRPSGVVANPLQPRTFTPTPLTPTAPFTPTPLQPTPLTPQPSPTTPTTPNTTDLQDLQNLVNLVGLGLVGLTQIAQGIQRNTTPAAIASAVCTTTQPGGCSANLANDTAGKINNNTNNALERVLNNTSNLANLALLPTINNKLGDQVPGGLSGFLGRLSKSLGIDRAINLIGFASNLHNAMMLSASLKITLLEVLSSVGNATGLLQTSEGDNVDLNVVFNQGIEKLLTLLVGEENYAGLKVGLRKHSAIFRAANNVLSNAGNMFSSIGNGIEVIGERTGKIGNALRAAGVVRENAYAAMSENMTVHTNKFMTYQNTVGGVTEVLETINEIAESTIEGQQSYTEAIKATAEFKKVLAEGTKEGAKDAENIAIAAEVAKIKENISKDPTGEKETGYLSFLTD